MKSTNSAYLLITCICLIHYNVSGQNAQIFTIDLPDSAGINLLDPTIDYSLLGLVLDQYGNAVEGAEINQKSINETAKTSDADGFFEIENIRADQILHIHKNGYVTNERVVDDFLYFLKDSNQLFLQVQLPVLDISLSVGPAGGVVEGAVSIDVPAGAVNSITEIKACYLPPGYLGSRDNNTAWSSLGSIHFEPAGFKFNKPISITVKMDQSSNQDIGPAVLHAYKVDRELITEEIISPDLVVSNNAWTFSISHFSDCMMVDKNTMIRKYPSSKKNDDSNLDGRVDDQDADRIVHLIGGTQSIEFNTTITSSQTVTKSKGRSTASSSSDTHAQGGGASVKGVGASVEEEKTTTLGKEESEEYGIELAKEQSFSSTVTVNVDEYNDRCKMLFTLYDVQHVLKYVRINPNPTELEHLKNNIGSDPPDDEGWHFRKVEGRSGVAVNRTLYEGMRLAVKVKADGSYEVFALADDLMVRTLKGLKASNCKDVKKSKIGGVRYYRYPPPSKNGAEIYSIRYMGLKRGNKPEKIFRGIECGTEAKEEWSESRSKMEFKETSESTSKENTSSVNVEAGVEIELGGIIQVEGHASHKTEKSEQVSNEMHHGVNTVESDQTTFSLTIYNAHEEHESDHDLYPLFHVYEVRDWFYEFPNSGKITNSLKKRMKEAKGGGDGRIQGEMKNGQRVLLDEEDGKEYWYISGPPVTVFRDAGKQLVRIEERPCVEEPPIETPKEKEPENTTEPTEDSRRTEAVPSDTQPDESSEQGKSSSATDSNERSGQDPKQEDRTTRPASEYGIAAGGSIAFPTNNSHEPSDGVQNLEELIYSDPMVFQEVFDALGGDFFLGTGSGPPSIEKGDLGVDIGWCLAGTYEFNTNWFVEISYGRYTNEWTSRFPITVFDSNTYDTFRVNGDISMDVTSSRLGIIANRSLNELRLSPFIGAGIQYSTRKLKSAQVNIEDVKFNVWNERDESHLGFLAQAGLDFHIMDQLSLRLVVQGAFESHPSPIAGGMKTYFIPASRLLITYGF